MRCGRGGTGPARQRNPSNDFWNATQIRHVRVNTIAYMATGGRDAARVRGPPPPRPHQARDRHPDGGGDAARDRAGRHRHRVSRGRRGVARSAPLLCSSCLGANCRCMQTRDAEHVQCGFEHALHADCTTVVEWTVRATQLPPSPWHTLRSSKSTNTLSAHPSRHILTRPPPARSCWAS